VADFTLTFPAPALADLVDDTINYNLAVEFTTDTALSCVGVVWRVPDTAPTGTGTAGLWETAGGTRIATGTSAFAPGDAGTLKQILFDTPVTLATATNYRASIHTPNRYVATTSDTWPKTTGILTAGAANGFLISALDPDSAAAVYPSVESGNDANFHVSPILRSADATSTSSRRRRSVTTLNRATEGRLNDILTILGTTAPSLWPFWELTGTLVAGISVGDLIPSETAGAAEALEDDFSPAILPSGLCAYHFHPTGDHHLAGIDHANYSFGDGTVDSPFSVGAWIRPNAIASNTIIAKYSATVREWRFWLDASGKLDLELYDESADTTEIAASTAALALGQWVFVVASYDGGETSPVVGLYVNGTLANDGTTVEAGAYIAMENTATPLTVGCSGVTATPVNEFHGRIALPFVTGKALSAVEVTTLYQVTAPMVGVA
jgi:hypothetical protein